MSDALALIAALASTMVERMVGASNNKDGIRGCEIIHNIRIWILLPGGGGSSW